ncbi:MAG: hypothetical protein AAGI17_02030 [Planctomycetota bacterium]
MNRNALLIASTLISLAVAIGATIAYANAGNEAETTCSGSASALR